MNPEECGMRYYGTDTCGLTKNTCYLNRDTLPDFCPLLKGGDKE